MLMHTKMKTLAYFFLVEGDETVVLIGVVLEHEHLQLNNFASWRVQRTPSDRQEFKTLADDVIATSRYWVRRKGNQNQKLDDHLNFREKSCQVMIFIPRPAPICILSILA